MTARKEARIDTLQPGKKAKIDTTAREEARVDTGQLGKRRRLTRQPERRRG
jgi:hypothetical protein